MVKQLRNPTPGARLRRIVARRAGANGHPRKNIMRKLDRASSSGVQSHWS